MMVESGVTGWIVDAPVWMWALGLAVSIGMTLLLYGWTSLPGLSKTGQIVLAALRGLAIGLIALLLIGPLMKHFSREVEPPHALILVDNSASVVLDMDSGWTADLASFVHNLSDELSGQTYNAPLLPFAASVAAPLSSNAPIAFSGIQTDIGGALEDIAYQYEGRNLAGVVLLTDGRSNRGVNPEYGARLPMAPLLTIGLGDTTRRADRAVDRLDWNRIAYLDNQFPVEALVSLHGETEAGSATVSLNVDGQVVERETIRWTEATKSLTRRIRFLANASRVGNLPCSVTIETGDAERITANNRQAFTIEVLEKRRRVLILGAAPHPDISALRSAFATSDRYTTEVRIASISSASGILGKLNNAIETADVVILHDLPGNSTRGTDWTQRAISSGKPRLHIQSHGDIGNAGEGLGAAGPTGGASEGASGAPKAILPGAALTPNRLTHNIRPAIASTFDLFDIPEALGTSREDLPPLTCPMGDIELSAAWRVALQRSLGGLNTGEPLAAFRDASADSPKLGWIIGSGWWRTRTASLAAQQTANPTEPSLPLDAFFQNAIQFLTSEDDIRQFRVSAPRRSDEDLAIQFKAEVYDASLEPFSGADIELSIQSLERPENLLTFTFTESTGDNPEDIRYAVDCGRLPAGNYKWRARTLLNGSWAETAGDLVVDAIQVEYASEPADHHLLTRLSERTGGQHLGAFDVNKTTELESAVTTWFADNRPPDLIFEEISLEEIIEWEWLGLILLALLTAEWVVRRRTIGY